MFRHFVEPCIKAEVDISRVTFTFLPKAGETDNSEEEESAIPDFIINAISSTTF